MSRFVLPALVIALVLVLAGPPEAAGQTEGAGIGATIGVSNAASATSRDPVGVAGKLWLSDRQALAAMTSFYVGGRSQSYWTVQGDYLFHNFTALSVGEGLLAAYVGGGFQYSVLEARTNEWAARSPAGITYLFDAAPVDIFVEVAPTVRVTQPEALRFEGSVGFRYFLRGGQ